MNYLARKGTEQPTKKAHTRSHTHPSRQNDHTKTKTKTNVGHIFGILSM